jgi:hypothetical protein
MTLTHHDTKRIKAKDWLVFELRNENTAEGTMRRVCAEIPGIFREHPVEVFVPVGARDLGVYGLMSGPYFYARTDHIDGACRMRSITGVAALVTSDGGTSPKRALRVEQAYIDDMRERSRRERDARCAGIGRGSFVRIMDSEYRELCGHVELVRGSRCVVKVELLTKQVFVETPLRNLLRLDHVPLERRVFYHCPLVEEMEEKDEGELQSDLHTSEQDLEDPEPPPQPRAGRNRHGGWLVSRTCRPYTEGLCAEQGATPASVADALCAALAGGHVRTPKNLSIAYAIVKAEWMKAHPASEWREAMREVYDRDKLTGKGMRAAAKAAGLELPWLTPEGLRKKDGRSHPRRKRKKKVVINWPEKKKPR